MRGDEFDKITSQIRQTTRRLADEWLKLADARLPSDHIPHARRRLRSVGSKVEHLSAQVVSAKGGTTRTSCPSGQMDRLASELIENRLSVLDLQRAYSVLQEASELERRLCELSVPPYDPGADTTPVALQEQLAQVWPLTVGLQAQLDELCVRASRACVPAHFFTWADSAHRRLEEHTARICRLKDEMLVDS
ncbi:hypothetical protein ACWC4D_23490 [Streptomyces sp. NPDC001288]|uniref:hypothetical protein n=1 Tax=unclassified Streptomyces TaxID=2593676 RepID=UPI00331B1F0D